MTRARRASAAALAGAALLLLGSCSSSPDDDSPGAAPGAAETRTQSDAPAPPSSTSGGTHRFRGTNLSESTTRAFVGKLNDALASGDDRAFLSVMDPQNRALVAQQRTWFANVQRAPLRVRRLHLVSTTDAADSSGRGRLAADVAFEHQFAGSDPRPVAEWYSFTFAQTPAGLTVTDIAGADADGAGGVKYSRYYRQAWDDGAMSVAAGRHVIVLGPASDQASLQAAAGTFDRAAEAVYATFARVGQPVPGSVRDRRWVVTVAAPDVPDIFDYFGGDIDPREAAFAGVTNPVFRTDTDTGFLETTEPAVTSRITASRTLIPSMGEASGSFYAVMRHELTHALTQEWQDQGVIDRPPTWVVEGIAEWVESGGAALPASELAAARTALSGGRLPASETFYAGDDAAVGGHYAAARAAIAYLVDTRGERTAFHVVRRLVTDTSGLTAVPRALGVGEGRFVAQLDRWISHG